MDIQFRVEGQSLKRVDNETVAANSKGFLFAKFDVDADWDGLTLKAVFEQNRKSWAQVLVTGICLVPVEVVSSGNFKVWLEGVDSDEVVRATTHSVKVNVLDGPPSDNENASEPTATEMEQALTYLKKAQEVAEEVTKRADDGEFNAKISSVTAETVGSDESASVENVGTQKDAKLVFKIPKGRTGDKGDRGAPGESFYAFFSTDDVDTYINEKKPDSFNMLWLGTEESVWTYGMVYYFTISYDENGNITDVSNTEQGALIGPTGPQGKDGESVVICASVAEMEGHFKDYGARWFSFLWSGNETEYNYTVTSGNEKNIVFYKGYLYRATLTTGGKITGISDKGNLMGEPGPQGVGIKSIERTSGNGAAGTVDTYTVTLTDDTKAELYVYNGKDGIPGDSVGIEKIEESNEDGGSNIVTFTTGNKMTVKNGSRGPQGYTPYVGDNGNWFINNKDTGVTALGTVITTTEIDENGHLIIHYSDGSSADAGKVVGDLNAGSGSGEYELINSITLTAADLSEDAKGWQFNIDKDGNSFSLKAVTCFCYFPPADETGTFELALMRSSTVAKGIHKRESVLSTSSERYCRISASLEGYWVASSMVGDNSTGAVDSYETWARNKLTEYLSFIRLASNRALPEGTIFEVYGVRV